VQARLWDAQDRQPEYLELAGGLDAAEGWATEHPDELTDVDHAFLRDFRQRTKERALRRRRERRWVWAMATVAVIAVLAAIAGVYGAREASDAKGIADAQRKTAQAESAVAKGLPDRIFVLKLLASADEQGHAGGDDELGALLALQAYRFNQRDHIPEEANIDSALRTVLEESHFSDIVPAPPEANLEAINQDGTVLVWSYPDG